MEEKKYGYYLNRSTGEIIGGDIISVVDDIVTYSHNSVPKAARLDVKFFYDYKEAELARALQLTEVLYKMINYLREAL